MGRQYFLDKGKSTGKFLVRHFSEHHDQFSNNFLEKLIPHEVRHLTMLGE